MVNHLYTRDAVRSHNCDTPHTLVGNFSPGGIHVHTLDTVSLSESQVNYSTESQVNYSTDVTTQPAGGLNLNMLYRASLAQT